MDTAPNVLSLVVTVAEAAHITGKSRRRILQYLADDRLRARQTLEGQWLIERHSLDPLIMPLKPGRPRSWE